MSDSLTSEFGPIRSFLWPIKRDETKKVVPMILMLFLICLCYSILRNMKDSVVVTTAGAEILPFLKVWALLPCAVLATYIFTKLTNRFTQEHVFYIVVSSFLVGYTLFGFVLYPMREILHPHALADSIEAITGCKRLVDLFRYWTLTGFYVMSELWSTMVMTVLFWGFANEVTKIGEARRFYSVFSVFSNMAAILAGQLANYFSRDGVYSASLPFGKTAWEQTMMIVVLLVVASGLIIMGIFRWMNTRVLNDSSFDDLHKAADNGTVRKKKKKKLSIRESVSFLSNSRYLICIAVIVVSYNLVINLVEVVWKSKLKEVLQEPGAYYSYMNNLTTCIGVFSTLAAFMMPRMMGKLGWTKTALITPVIMLVTSMGFFFFMFSQGLIGETLLGFQTASLCILFGTAQNCMSKAAKYSVFDATKEISFIPLSHEVKLKGKAAIDGVGSRLGKSGGSVIHMGLLMVFSTLTASAPYVAAILVAVIGGWFVATRALGKQFNAMIAGQGDSELMGEESQAEAEPVRQS